MDMRPISAADRISSESPGSNRAVLMKRLGLMLGIFALIAAAVVGYRMLGDTARKTTMRAQGATAQAVSTAEAATQDWVPQVATVGDLKAVNGADLSFEVSGIIDEINFNSGDEVKAGTVLVRLRADDEIAKLRALEATARLATVTNNRSLELVKSQNVSQATLDINAANLANAKAQVAEQQALVDKKIIRAPFSGTLGLHAADRGQYVSPGMTIVTLQSLDALYFDFNMPQQYLDRVKVGSPIVAKIDTFPNEEFAGTLTAINSKVDPLSRNVQARATLKNDQRRLLPGMYATAKITAGEALQPLTIPQTAIIYSPYGDAVYVLDKKVDGAPDQWVARYQFVTLGERRGDFVAILSGLKKGEQVVTAGAIKLRNGSLVKVDNSARAPVATDPKPPIP
jgi:membrane fusion protein (multidrug efflux system)